MKAWLVAGEEAEQRRMGKGLTVILGLLGLHRGSGSSWSSWVCGRTHVPHKGSGRTGGWQVHCLSGHAWEDDRTRADVSVGPGHEWGRNTSRRGVSDMSVSPSLLNPLSLPIPSVPSLSRAQLFTSIATTRGYLVMPQTPKAKGGCLRRQGGCHMTT